MTRTETPEQVNCGFREQSGIFWPVAVVRSHCERARASETVASFAYRDKEHFSYALYGRSGKARFSIYVPDELAEDVEKPIQNGRDLQKLMTEAGRGYTLALKNERRRRSGKERRLVTAR